MGKLSAQPIADQCLILGSNGNSSRDLSSNGSDAASAIARSQSFNARSKVSNSVHRNPMHYQNMQSQHGSQVMPAFANGEGGGIEGVALNCAGLEVEKTETETRL
ncbi:MAG: hypothetical protein JNM42_00665 [Propionivibrio sp.]|nr:hypothetical protein [Propionivibrio sp.]